MIESLFSCPSSDIAVRVFGVKHRHLEIVSRGLDVTITPRGLELILCGEEENVTRALDLFVQLRDTIERGMAVHETDVVNAVDSLSQSGSTRIKEILVEAVLRSHDGKTITPRTENQLAYVNALRSSELVFGVGPAGTGKTFLAMAMALSHFVERRVRRIILTRPAVEAGEKLGFLPGDLEQKVNPYLRPLYDALFELFDRQRARSLLSDGTIEVAPMGFMRGRTLKDAFIILDEAQNTTPAQMKMFLTRMGEGSLCVVNGDISQIDLPDHQESGLVQAISYLDRVEGISICRFTRDDVIRHPLVQRIIDAYDTRN